MDLDVMSEDEREHVLVDVFSWIQSHGGRLPVSAYWERLKTFPTVYHESIEFCRSYDGTSFEVLLDQRPSDDPNFAGQYGTQGFTVMNGQTLEKLVQHHNKTEITFSSPEEFRFCGLAVAPLGEREKTAKGDHPYIVIFARILEEKPVMGTGGEYKQVWLSVDKLSELPVISVCKAYIEVAVNVMLRGAIPHYLEFLGTV